MYTTQEIAPHAIVENDSIKNFPALPLNYYYNLALLYAENGFYVFPIQGNKFPYKGFEWTKRASNNPEEIKKMWQEYPNGVPALYCRPSNIVVIDIDHKPKKNKYGFVVFDKYVTKLGKLAKTVEIFTRSNGIHLYYRHNPDIILQRGIEDCIDIQTNHYCVCGGVYTPEGSYRFRKGHTFEDIGEIPELSPAWLEFLAKSPRRKYTKKKNNSSNEAKEVINGDFKKLYDNCLFVQYAVKNGASLKEFYWFIFAAILSKLSNGFEIFDFYSKPYPEYDFDKTRSKFINAQKYGYSCKTIAEDFTDCKKCKYYNN